MRFLCGVFVLVLGLALCQAQEPQSFSFVDFFVGEWDVQRSVVSMSESEQTLDDWKGRMFVERENGTHNLLGRFYENDTLSMPSGQMNNHFLIFIELENTNSGQFKTSPFRSVSTSSVEEEEEEVEEEDDDEFETEPESAKKTTKAKPKAKAKAKTTPTSSTGSAAHIDTGFPPIQIDPTSSDTRLLFSFAFEAQSNGIQLAHGTWHGEALTQALGSSAAHSDSDGDVEGARKGAGSWIDGHKGFFQFTIASWDKFQITIFADKTAEAMEVVIYEGKKVPVVTAQSFFQRYSFGIMIVGFFLFNMFVQKKARQFQQPLPPQRRRSDGATIEEVHEEDETRKKKKSK